MLAVWIMAVFNLNKEFTKITNNEEQISDIDKLATRKNKATITSLAN